MHDSILSLTTGGLGDSNIPHFSDPFLPLVPKHKHLLNYITCNKDRLCLPPAMLSLINILFNVRTLLEIF